MSWVLFIPLLASAAVSAAKKSAMLRAAAAEGEEGDELSVFQLVSLRSDVCKASDGTMGTCCSSQECSTGAGLER